VVFSSITDVVKGGFEHQDLHTSVLERKKWNSDKPLLRTVFVALCIGLARWSCL